MGNPSVSKMDHLPNLIAVAKLVKFWVKYKDPERRDKAMPKNGESLAEIRERRRGLGRRRQSVLDSPRNFRAPMGNPSASKMDHLF